MRFEFRGAAGMTEKTYELDSVSNVLAPLAST